jgi:hypothetical protein
MVLPLFCVVAMAYQLVVLMKRDPGRIEDGACGADCVGTAMLRSGESVSDRQDYSYSCSAKSND